jgi:hypothetical protein
MSNSNQLFNKNIPLLDLSNLSEKQFLIDRNKRTSELFYDNIEEHSYAKMIIEVFISKN